MAVTAVVVVVAVVNTVAMKAVVVRDVDVVVPLDIDRGVHVAGLVVHDNFRSVHELADHMAGHNLDHSAGLADSRGLAALGDGLRLALVTLGNRRVFGRSRFGRCTFRRRSLSRRRLDLTGHRLRDRRLQVTLRSVGRLAGSRGLLRAGHCRRTRRGGLAERRRRKRGRHGARTADEILATRRRLRAEGTLAGANAGRRRIERARLNLGGLARGRWVERPDGALRGLTRRRGWIEGAEVPLLALGLRLALEPLTLELLALAEPLAGEARRALAAELLAALALTLLTLAALGVGGKHCGEERGRRDRNCEDADHDNSPGRGRVIGCELCAG